MGEALNSQGSHKRKRLASLQAVVLFGVPYEIRTRVIAVKGRCPRPLDEGDLSFEIQLPEISVSWWR
jgi:hypothetical protein